MLSMLVAQRYEVVRELGAGAMGRVSLALDQQSNQLVALKQMHVTVAAMGGLGSEERIQLGSSKSRPHSVFRRTLSPTR